MQWGWGMAIDAYLLYLAAGGSPSTTIELRGYQLRRLARALPSGPLSVETADLVDWMAARGWSPSTLRSHRQTFIGFFGWMVDSGARSDSPATGLPTVKPPPPSPRPVGHDAYLMALELAPPRERLMLRLAGELGMRRSEVAQVHRDDLVQDLTGWTLVVHGKGGKRRLLPLPDSIAHDLLAEDPGWLFPGRVDGHISPAWVGKIVARLLPEGYSMHKLRHMFATDAYGVDRDLFTVQDLLGHASPTTTRAYVLVPDSAKRALVTKIGEERRSRMSHPA